MDRQFLAAVLALILFTGCTTFESQEEKEAKYGKEPPVIEQSFASKAMRKGDTWRIYLRASDPGGDMKNIIAYFRKGGGGSPTAVSHTQIKENDRREINGYLYWYPGPEVDGFPEMAITIQIEDMAGHFSKPVSLPLKIQPSGSQELPPEGAFQEKELGPIMITLKPVGASAGSRSRLDRVTDPVRSNLWLGKEILGVKTELKGNILTIEGIGFQRAN